MEKTENEQSQSNNDRQKCKKCKKLKKLWPEKKVEKERQKHGQRLRRSQSF